MQINLPVPALMALALVSACSAPRPAPPRPAPTPAAPPAPAPVQPAPAPPPAAPRASEWRDVALTPGTWSYRGEGSATVAAFAAPDGSRLFALTCHRERGSVTLTRAGKATGSVPASLVTTFGVRPASFTPISPTDPTLDLSLPARDPALDELAFSRGRIAIEISGLPTLYLPVWAEIGRVIEDCRR
jgi:hypothetical protein